MEDWADKIRHAGPVRRVREIRQAGRDHDNRRDEGLSAHLGAPPVFDPGELRSTEALNTGFRANFVA